MMYEDYYDDYDAYAAEIEAEMAAQAEAEAQAAAEAEAEMQAEAEAAEAEWAENFRKEYGLYPDEVKELAKAKEEKRLVILPCAVGSTIYKPDIDGIIIGKVLRANVYSSFVEFEVEWSGGFIRHDIIHADNVGINVFTSQEEAERALRGEHK